ncbi:MAG: P-loop NTPase [Candidatus Odinarchaeota archaeon]
MKQLTVISGKGGTGKTTVTAALLNQAKNKISADADVDAPNLHLILHPEIKKTTDFYGLDLAVKDDDLCTSCGLCEETCRFGAISGEEINYAIDKYSCEGCAACEFICPEKAIKMVPRKVGVLYESVTRFSDISHALLDIGQENSGKLVAEVRKQANDIAKEKKNELIIIDGPPGIGCPVLAAIADSNLVLIVTEATKTAIHDFQRVVDVTNHFNIPVAVCINKYTIAADMTAQIEKYCKDNNIPVAGKIPYDKKMYEAVLAGQSIVEYDPDGVVATQIRGLWKNVSDLLELPGMPELMEKNL